MIQTVSFDLGLWVMVTKQQEWASRTGTEVGVGWMGKRVQTEPRGFARG